MSRIVSSLNGFFLFAACSAAKLHAWYLDRVHRSVLVREVIEHLSPRNDAVYVDCTVGYGGHSEAILGAAHARVIGVDRDPIALAATRERLGDRIQLVHGELAEI